MHSERVQIKQHIQLCFEIKIWDQNYLEIDLKILSCEILIPD